MWSKKRVVSCVKCWKVTWRLGIVCGLKACICHAYWSAPDAFRGIWKAFNIYWREEWWVVLFPHQIQWKTICLVERVMGNSGTFSNWFFSWGYGSCKDSLGLRSLENLEACSTCIMPSGWKLKWPLLIQEHLVWSPGLPALPLGLLKLGSEYLPGDSEFPWGFTFIFVFLVVTISRWTRDGSVCSAVC